MPMVLIKSRQMYYVTSLSKLGDFESFLAKVVQIFGNAWARYYKNITFKSKK